MCVTRDGGSTHIPGALGELARPIPHVLAVHLPQRLGSLDGIRKAHKPVAYTTQPRFVRKTSFAPIITNRSLEVLRPSLLEWYSTSWIWSAPSVLDRSTQAPHTDDGGHMLLT